MPASGTYAFNPSLGSLTQYAYGLAGVRRTAILQEHIEDARMAANLLLIGWSSLQVNLWEVGLISTPLVQGTATYTVDPSVAMILDAYITTTVGGSPIDRIIWPISRTEWASMPNKTTPGPPTSFWFDRLIAPTITLWPVPDADGPYTLNQYVVRTSQDAVMAGNVSLDVQKRFLDAFVWALAARLAVTYGPDRAAALAAQAKEAWSIAAAFDVENVPLVIAPAVSVFYRR